MRIDNEYYNGLLDKHLGKIALILLFIAYMLHQGKNGGVNSCTQSMARKDFPLLSYPFPIPLVSQSGKHHKEPMCFLYLLCLTFLHIQKFIISLTFVLYLIKGSLIGLVYRNIF